ncbi:MAG: fumarate reductase/succinate dehydrogenase flavoprotein subunit [Deltaproteobacteria bacterium]|nr:fumarate reductase/succinate dehydrogenase flavoprotein subunit [Deltaproteobacteria bacterium]
MDFQVVEHDVLVIGAGGAGLRAAIEASAHGVSTGIVCKSLLGKAHTVMAEGGMAAALGNVAMEDNWQVHFRDTMRGGKMLNNWKMAQIHAKEAPERVNELEAWGAVFDRTEDGRILQRNFGGHRYPRLAHVGDRTGLELIRTLQDKGIHQGIEVYMECNVQKLLIDDGRICGAVGYWRPSGKFVLFKAKSIILATGGVGKCFKVSSNSWEYTGDGHALAYHAGADLIDLEFMQFHPTGMVWPPSVKGTLITEAVRGEGGILTNSHGERFMFKNIPEAYKEDTADTLDEAERWYLGEKGARRAPELLTRDVVARAIMKEVNGGRGTAHGGVHLDIASRRPADYIKKKLPSMYHQFKKLADVDITKQPMEVAPTAHYMMGGVRVDAETQESTVQGLYAAGECSAGLHGANRLGGNSLSDLLVFGRRAGYFAAQTAKKKSTFTKVNEAEVDKSFQEMLAPLNKTEGLNPYDVFEKLQDTMSRNVNIAREESELKQALVDLANLKKELPQVKVDGNRDFNPGWHQALDLYALMTVSEAMTRAALERKESRGGHTRVDFPNYDEKFSKINVVIRKKGEEMEVSHIPLPEMTEEISALLVGM